MIVKRQPSLFRLAKLNMVITNAVIGVLKPNMALLSALVMTTVFTSKNKR